MPLLPSIEAKKTPANGAGPPHAGRQKFVVAQNYIFVAGPNPRVR